MTTKHTPESWKAIRDVSSNRINIWADDGNEWIGEVEDMIDARLIAAAPDLLEMLEMMAAQHFCGCRHPACKRCKDDDDCADVIAKAKGETK